jgi:hypothetical protein
MGKSLCWKKAAAGFAAAGHTPSRLRDITAALVMVIIIFSGVVVVWLAVQLV